MGDTSSPEYDNFPIGMENANSGNCPTQTLVDAYEMKMAESLIRQILMKEEIRVSR